MEQPSTLAFSMTTLRVNSNNKSGCIHSLISQSEEFVAVSTVLMKEALRNSIVFSVLAARPSASFLRLYSDWTKRRPTQITNTGIAISTMPRLSFVAMERRILLVSFPIFFPAYCLVPCCDMLSSSSSSLMISVPCC